MTLSVLKKAIFISLLGHFIIFTIFTFSFGKKIPQADFSSVKFWGQIMPLFSVNCPKLKTKLPGLSISGARVIYSNPVTNSGDLSFLPESYERPAYFLPFNAEKVIFLKEINPISGMQRKEPAIIFHPLLPYSFMLYFKDRQIVHVELIFNIVNKKRTSIMLKRKISSGNLEVDLLTLRYIGRYLSMQKARFASGLWQAVKIDLSESSFGIPGAYLSK